MFDCHTHFGIFMTLTIDFDLTNIITPNGCIHFRLDPLVSNTLQLYTVTIISNVSSRQINSNQDLLTQTRSYY